MDKNAGIIGTGKLGINILHHLKKNGIKISGIFNKDIFKSETTAKKAGVIFFKDKNILVHESDIIFITTPDDIIHKVANEIASNNNELGNKIFFHCSGSLPSTILENLEKKNALTASMHPLQSFAGLLEEKNPFKNIIMGIEGNKQAVETAEIISKKLGAIPYFLKTEGKILYHTAAVTASNYLVTLTEKALELLETAGIEKEKGLNIITPLMKGTIENIISKGTKKALTGPVSRGDYETVKSHMEQISKKAPEIRSFYKIMCEETIKLAESSGAINRSQSKKIIKALE
ncbi:MAG: hypothetical protein CSB21_02955 [Deltaproteobacteria bacterium]|nr:MAG: hypothetical protein CSB21_02955 [Deltaproteobacteria bacterium]